MTNKKIKKLESPLNINKNSFINSTPENINQPQKKTRAQPVTFTFYSSDITMLEQQLDRAINLRKRSKNKSVIIRMALKALENCSDEEYLELYEEF